jgi:hypothetical protein
MPPKRGSRKADIAAASSLSIGNQLLDDIEESINYDDDDDESQTTDDKEDSIDFQ